MLKKWILIIVALMLVQSTACASPYPGRRSDSPRTTSTPVKGVVTHVTDGDTLWVRLADEAQATDIRIQGIDAPEICQDYGRIAFSALSDRVLHHTVIVTGKARDTYGRLIAQVRIGQEDIGAWLVLNGHAWSSRYHQSLGMYAQQEMAARASGRGLWARGRAIEPRVFRKKTKCH